MNRLEQLRRIQKQGFDLFARKNADYGDAFANYGAVGVLVRIGDKLNRLASVTSNKIVLVDDETLRDTLIDLHNYSAMAIMCLDENDAVVNDSKKNNDVILLGDGSPEVSTICGTGYCVEFSGECPQGCTYNVDGVCYNSDRSE